MHSLDEIMLDLSLHSFHIFPIDPPYTLNVDNSLLHHNEHNTHLAQTFDRE